MGDCMPLEQQQWLDEMKTYLMNATNMKEDEAEVFSFRLWQLKDMRGFQRIVTRFNKNAYVECPKCGHMKHLYEHAKKVTDTKTTVYQFSCDHCFNIWLHTVQK